MNFRETQLRYYTQGGFSQIYSAFPDSDILCVAFKPWAVYPISLFSQQVDRIGKYQKSIHYVLFWDLQM